MKRLFSLFILTILLNSCAYELNPTTGKKEVYKKSWDNELKTASTIRTEIQERFALIQSADLKNYIQQISDSIVQHSIFAKDTVQKNYPDFKLTIEIIDSETVSSFIVPPSTIYITSGLLVQLNNEAQLAYLLGHQLAHLVNRPFSSRKVEIRSEIPAFITLNQFAEKHLSISETFSLEELSLSMPFLYSRFSKEDEKKAHQLGSVYALKAGYKPSEFNKTLTHLALCTSTLSLLPNFSHTHSLIKTEKSSTSELASVWQSEEQSELLNTNEYVSHIAGLTVKQTLHGYKAGKTVYHPKLFYQFNLPSDWNLVAQKNKLILTDENNYGVLIIQAVQKSGTVSAIVNEWFIKHNLAADFRKAHFTNALNRYETYATHEVDGQNYTIFIASVEMKSYYILLKGIAKTEYFPALKPYFAEPFFSLITNPDPSKFYSKTLTLTKTTADTTVKLTNFYPSSFSTIFTLEEFSFMNQTDQHSEIEKGTIIKSVK